MSAQIHVAVIYHSGYGHTAKQAEAVAAGAASAPNTVSTLIAVADIDQHWEALEGYDAIIFGAPTYMGSASAQFKAFMDATSRTVFAKGSVWKDKIAAGFTNSASRSGDKLNTLQQMAIFAAQHGMHWVNLGLPPGHNASTTTEDALNRHTYFLGAGAQSDADTGPDQGATESDLKTSAHLGRRVATVALELSTGRQALRSRD
ncbi:flavodoxin family protein [Duganella aceris]|uniref:Flavoprotein WrbA n=1 Tax=Duganella aceris TaxID=2703883 RepID=A0ABX0FRN1_9BURK|nr:flavodoxin family protein [Duganella aceris]NGZ87327.1 flavodoxin family protein [Duganella aceris]